MPITIWKPRQYVDQFVDDSYTDTSTGKTWHYTALNGPTKDAPYNKDTKVREITRYTGWKETHFCDTGEFEIVTQDVSPEDVKIGYMVEIDGEHFVIETYRWEVTESGHKCTIGGRDLWRFPDCHIRNRARGGVYSGVGSSNPPFTGSAFMNEIAMFYYSYWLAAGWYRDLERFPRMPQDAVPFDYRQQNSEPEDILRLSMTDAQASAFKAESKGTPVVSDIMSYGSEWRMFANWFNVGISFDLIWNEYTGLYQLEPVIYYGKDNGVELSTSSRGVSGFEYGVDTRNVVNGVMAEYESKSVLIREGSYTYQNESFGGDITSGTTERRYNCTGIGNDGSSSFSERAANFAEKYVNLGRPEEDNDDGGSKFRSWLKDSISGQYVDAEETASVSYDNSGAYRYGEHFNLGDFITVSDPFLGIAVKQRLTGVKTKYEGGKAAEYEFEFGSKRITQSDILRKRFAAFEKVTGSKLSDA